MMKAALRGAGEAHHGYVPGKLKDVSGVDQIGAIGKANLALTGRPQPRRALVIAEDALVDAAYERDDVEHSEAATVIERIRARGWEVMLADEERQVRANNC